MGRTLSLIVGVVLTLSALAAGGAGGTRQDASSVASLDQAPAERITVDWLIGRIDRHSGVYRGKGPHELVMTNGLISRTFLLAPNAVTIGFDNLLTGQSILRGVKPEAVIRIDGADFDIGGLRRQPVTPTSFRSLRVPRHGPAERQKRRGKGRGLDHHRWPNAFFAAHGLYMLTQARAQACQSVKAVH